MMTKGAIGNLINRYEAVLQKCRLLNVFGSLAAALLLVAGSAGAATAFEGKFFDHVPEYPDFVVGGVSDVGPPAESTAKLENWQTGVAWGVDNGADTPALVYVDQNNGKGENYGSIWVKNSDKGGYAEGMGGKYGMSFELTNHGYIYVDGTDASATKGMGVNPDGKAVNEGLIAVRKGSAMTDNSGSAHKTLINNGVISVEDAGGVGIFYRKENVTGEVTNNGTIRVGNGGTGVLITNDKKDDASYNDKYFTNTGTISAEEGSTAIRVENTDNAAIRLKGDKSHVNGLISLEGTNTQLLLDGMGAGGVENLYVKGTFSGAIENNSHVVFTDRSQIALDDTLSIDEKSTATIHNASLVRGDNAPDKALISFDASGAALNGGLNTGGSASADRADFQKSGVALDHAVVSGNSFLADHNAALGGVNVSLTKDQSLAIRNSLFADNTVTLTNASSQAGGAGVAVSGGASTSISGTDFIGNRVNAEQVRGGALLLDTPGSSVALNNVSFKNNTANGSSAGLGGAVYNGGSSLTVADASFSGNMASLSGGALYNADGGSLTFRGTNILSANFAGTAANDVHNAGSLIVESGVTRFDSGYSQQGSASSLKVNSGASLAIAMPDMGGVTAAPGEALLALGQPLDLGGGSLVVGESSARSAADVSFGKNSLLVVDGASAKNGPMLSGTGSLAVDDGSKLYIANARAGESYTVTSGLSLSDGDYWKTANLLAGRLIEAEISSTDGKIMIHTEAQEAGRTLPGIIPVAALDAMTGGGLNNTESDSMGIRFLSRAMDNVQFMQNDDAATAMVNEVSRASVTAGVQNTTLRLADAGADQLARHLSLSFFGKENSMHKDGTDVWATPMYGNTYTHGMTASGTSVRGNYGGLALGADTGVGEILGGKVRVGAALTGGGGKSSTGGTVTDVENSYNFGGLHVYAGWNAGNLNVTGSMGITLGTNDVSMKLPSSMGMGQARADIDTAAFVSDLRAEYRISTAAADIVPHAGVRYTALNTDRHDVKVNGSPLNSVASDTQHIVQFPVGVTVSKDIDVSGWNLKPLADVSVIPAAGEKNHTTKVSYSGIRATDSVNTRIMDSTSWAGTLGVQAEKGNLALGLNYGLQASSRETDQSVSVGISWKF